MVESQRHLLSLRVVRPTALVAAAQAPTGGEAAPAQAPEHTPSSALPAGTSASAGVSGRASGSAAASHRRVKVRRIAKGVVELTAGAGPAGAHTGTGSGAGASISTTGAWSAPGVAAANTEVRPPAVTGSGPSQGQRSTQLSSVAGSLAAPEAAEQTAAAAAAAAPLWPFTSLDAADGRLASIEAALMAALEDAAEGGDGGAGWRQGEGEGAGERGVAGSAGDRGSVSLRLLSAAVSAERLVRIPFEVELRGQGSGGSETRDGESDSVVVVARQTWEAVARVDAKGGLKLMKVIAENSVSGGSLVIASSVLSGNDTVVEASPRRTSFMLL